MKVADKKIDQEEQRLIVWERTIRKRFANLDAVLSTYNNQMKALEAAVKQLNSNSSTRTRARTTENSFFMRFFLLHFWVFGKANFAYL